jgi:hypothetical protein
VERQVSSGRIRKHHHQRTNEVREATRDVYGGTNDDPPSGTIASDDDEDHAYQEASTDGNSTEESGSGTEKDTPTRIAVERRRHARSELRAKIMTQPLVRSGDYSTSGPSSSSHLSSSIGLCTPLLSLPSEMTFTEASSSGAVTTAPPPVNKCWANPPSRRNMMTGRERVLLEAARVQVLRFTLFTDPFPSATTLTSYIHTAWEETEKQFLTNIEVSPESLGQVSGGKTVCVREGMLKVI